MLTYARGRTSAARVALTGVAVIGLALPLAAVGNEGSEAPDTELSIDPDSLKDLTSPELSLATDVGLLASANGWTTEQAQQATAMAKAFGVVQERLADERPGLYAGGELPSVPTDPAKLYIKGAPDAHVVNVANAAGSRIEIVAGRAYSALEMEARTLQLHDALERLGYRDITTSFDEASGLAEATVAARIGLPATADALRLALPGTLRSGVRIDVVDGSIGSDLHAYGGMVVRDDGRSECTSGWAVRRGGTTGVTTAGHCTGINQIVEPGVGVYRLRHQREHRGRFGDVEWKTSNHVEPALFYASQNDRRTVRSVERRAGISRGETVCAYGRFSNRRTCGMRVLRTSVSCTISGRRNDRLVAMNGRDVLIGGDSGGGWSFGSTAYGSTKGFCNVAGGLRLTFSVADLYDEALGVRVRTG